MPTIAAAASLRRPATTTPSSAGASRSSQPMSAEPKVGCWRLGSGMPAAWGRGRSRAWSSRPARSASPRRARRRAPREPTRPTRIDHAGATIATAEAAARQASAISAMPAASCTRPLASQATNQSPTATGGQSHQRRLPRKNPPAAASTGVPNVASSASACGALRHDVDDQDAGAEQRRRHRDPHPAPPAGPRLARRRRDRRRLSRAEHGVRRDEGERQLSSEASRRPSGPAPRAGSGCPRASRTSNTSPAGPR